MTLSQIRESMSDIILKSFIVIFIVIKYIFPLKIIMRMNAPNNNRHYFILIWQHRTLTTQNAIMAHGALCF